ncbi:transcriptional regulator, LysR family [Salipiger profundus]|nr:transcriptional regulator, LysR family [Salipiger profundus]
MLAYHRSCKKHMTGMMELIWFEDFLEIASVRNFSAAAAARHISQPAFSRRIRALEAWLGAELLDRSTQPVRLTSVGTMFLPRCQSFVREIYRLRGDCSSVGGSALPVISFASLTSLAVYFFPGWNTALNAQGLDFRASMDTGDYRDSLQSMASGKSDFAIVYDHPDGPPLLEAGHFQSKIVGWERLVLVTGVDADGLPRHGSGPLDAAPLPYLSYAWNDGYLDKLVSLMLTRRRKPLNLQIVFQSSLIEAIKHMAIAGRGVAWLPQLSIQDALDRGQLVQIGDPGLTTSLEIRLFRRQGHRSAESDALWNMLPERPEPGA